MFVKQLVRNGIEQIPILPKLYRTLRDELIFDRKKPVLTPLGFWFSGDKSMELGLFEPDESSIIINHLDDTDLFVDIGANVGYYTCLTRSKGKKVIAVEPNPMNVRALFRNLQLNSWKNVEVWPIGLAESPGSMTLWGGGTGASLIEGWAGISKSWKQPVAVNTLDNILSNRFSGKRLFIKVDVEGAEFGALQGAKETLQREPHPLWLVEITLSIHHPNINKNFYATFDLFSQNGYVARTVDKEKRIVSQLDVKRWVEIEYCDFGKHNWLFSVDK